MPDLNCIIVEDEAIHSNRLKKLLALADSRINIIATCHTIEDAYNKISIEKPDLVMLDIQLHDRDRGGFELLQMIGQPNFDVIFTTAHIDGNIQEIRRCGIDYIVKPYIQDELDDALRKVWEKRNGHVGVQQLDMLLRNLITEQLDEQLIWLKLSEGSIPVKIKNLVYCEGKDQYTVMHIIDEHSNVKVKEIITSIGIGAWEKDLAQLRFCRCHESYLINLRHVLKIVPKESAVYLKHISIPLSMSRTGKERLNAIINKTTPIAIR